MPVKDVVETLRSLLRERSRRAWIGKNRAHIEYRDIDADELEVFAGRVRDGVSRLSRVRSLEINSYTRRVVIAFDDFAYDLARLVRVVEEAERAASLERARFVDEEREHPADIEAAQRLVFELGTDFLGFAIGCGLRLSPFSASRIAGATASVLAIVSGSPRLRAGIDERLGPTRADLVMNLAEGIMLGLAQRPVASLVEVTHKAALLREVQARRRQWEAREDELCAQSADAKEIERRARDVRGEPRPRPLPRGPIEEYTDRAWVVALAGFGVSFLTTRNFQRAVGALFGGLPKPARLGRDVFCAELGRGLAARGVLVLDSGALRRLDRIDCLVLQGDLVARDRFEIGEVACEDEIEPPLARRRAARLFDPEYPIDVSVRHNHAPVPRFPALHALRLGVFGDPAVTSWLPGPLTRALRALYRRPRPAISLASADRAMVIDYYRDEIARAGHLTGHDLSAWLR